MPALGIVACTALASVAMLVSHMGANGSTVFTTLVLMTGITAAVPHAFSAMAQIKWRWTDHEMMHTPRLVRDLTVAVLALAFSVAFIWYSRNTGHAGHIVWGPFLMAGGAAVLGFPVYLAQRRRLTAPPETPAFH